MWVASGRGSAASNRVSTETPAKLVPSLLQRVTQWMSPSKWEAGRAWISSQVHSVGVLTSPSTLNRQEARSTRGVGPAVSTGNPGSAYWPGGSRVASPAAGRRRRLNPRDTNPPTVHLLLLVRQPWHGPPHRSSRYAGAGRGVACRPWP